MREKLKSILSELTTLRAPNENIRKESKLSEEHRVKDDRLYGDYFDLFSDSILTSCGDKSSKFFYCKAFAFRWFARFITFGSEIESK